MYSELFVWRHMLEVCKKQKESKKRERSRRSGGPTMISFTELCNHGDPLPTGAWLEDLDTRLERWQQNTDDVHSTAWGSSAVFFQSKSIASINSKIHWCAAQTFSPVQIFVHSVLFFLWKQAFSIMKYWSSSAHSNVTEICIFIRFYSSGTETYIE